MSKKETVTVICCADCPFVDSYLIEPCDKLRCNLLGFGYEIDWKKGSVMIMKNCPLRCDEVVVMLDSVVMVEL